MTEPVRVAILISGGGSNMVSLVKAMQGDGIGAVPCLVLANIAQADGLQKAQALGIETAFVAHKDYKDRESFEDALHAVLEAHQINLICLAGFMRILTPGFVERWERRMLNIHPSILPLFPGLNTHARALEAGMCVHGASVHEVTRELDAGRILGQAVVPVLAEDSVESLAARVLVQEHRLYPEVLRRFVSGDARPVTLLSEAL